MQWVLRNLVFIRQSGEGLMEDLSYCYNCPLYEKIMSKDRSSKTHYISRNIHFGKRARGKRQECTGKDTERPAGSGDVSEQDDGWFGIPS